MEHFFVVLGFCSIAFWFLYILKVYSDNKAADSAFIEDIKVYEAARLFIKGDSKKVKELLLKCIDFDEEEANEIISMAEKDKTKKSDGHVEFLSAVNKVLGKNIYKINHNNMI